MINFQANDTVIINASQATPTAIKLYFGEHVFTTSERDSVIDVLKYWTRSTPIAGDDFVDYIWNDECNILTVKADFDKGSFYGDLLHHDAVGLGDEKFGIGLVRLFGEGYSPQTRRGKGVSPADVSPICIEFIYEEEVEAEEVNVAVPLLDAILNNIRLDVAQAKNQMLRGSVKRLRNTLLEVAKEMSEYV